MDPNAAVRTIIELLDDKDWQAARERYDDLKAWIARGGFRPDAYDWELTILEHAPRNWSSYIS